MKLDEAMFQEKIELIRKTSMGVPKIINIDLGTAIADQEFNIAGNLFYVFNAPSEAEYVGIRINETREPMINFSALTGMETPFYRLYITTPAGQAGTLQIIYGTEAPEMLRIIDNRSTTVAGVGGVLDELRGDVTPELVGAEITCGVAQVQLLAANANRKGCNLCADILNTGNVYLGFDATVTTSAGGDIWFHVLTPGASFQIDDYRGPIHAIATLANQEVGVGEW